MIKVIADNILSPLGLTTRDNVEAVHQGLSALQRYAQRWQLPEPFVASLFSDTQWAELQVEGLTRFESIVVQSVSRALQGVDVPLTERTCFILSTTKANVEHIACCEPAETLPAEAAQRIAEHLGFSTQPLVVCNACTSGVVAQITAMRLLRSGAYDYAVVCGADVQSQFIVSGFQSLKSTSDEPCRPFDIERLGLNLGEAAATLVLARCTEDNGEAWYLNAGAIYNDALHITNPSPKGVGSTLALQSVLQHTSTEALALVNLHGTATMYNDQMESKAIEAAGLSAVPANALKGYYGHTMGAAGVLETILSLHQVDNGTVEGTRGFSEMGVSGKVNIAATARPVAQGDVVKLISGFGGCNGAVRYSREPQHAASAPRSWHTAHSLTLTPDSLTIDGHEEAATTAGSQWLTHLYKTRVGDYAKYYKMDALCKLGFLASELLLQAEGEERFVERTDRAVVLFNHSSSIVADREFQKSIASADDFFPSPSVFVYTLPNIVTGEIAIRNGYRGETSFYILPHPDHPMMQQVIETTLCHADTHSMLCGWVEAMDAEHFEARLQLVIKD